MEMPCSTGPTRTWPARCSSAGRRRRRSTTASASTKHALPQKASGVYRAEGARAWTLPAMLGLGETFAGAGFPLHRGAGEDDVERHGELDILAASDRSGLCLVEDAAQRRAYDVQSPGIRHREPRCRVSAVTGRQAMAAAHPVGYYLNDDPAERDRQPLERGRAAVLLKLGN